MDFVSNILKKTPFKSEASEDKEKPDDEANGEGEKKQGLLFTISDMKFRPYKGDLVSLSEREFV